MCEIEIFKVLSYKEAMEKIARRKENWKNVIVIRKRDLKRNASGGVSDNVLLQQMLDKEGSGRLHNERLSGEGKKSLDLRDTPERV